MMASGATDEIKGRVKEAAGAVTGDAKLKREGRSDQTVGKLEQKAEKAIDRESTNGSAAVALTTKAGTHTFRLHDRLWVQCTSAQGPSAREARPVTEVRQGDLVAFLGRVLSVQFVTEGKCLFR